MKKISLLILVLIAWVVFLPRTPETLESLETPQTQVVPAPIEKPIEKPIEPQPSETYFLLEETNRERVSRGLGALALKQSLIDSARLKCLDMQTRNYWAHSINDEPFWKDFTDEGSLGENLGRTNETPQKVFQAWMDSTTHKRNILNPGFTRIGFASCDGPQQHLIVQHFWGK